MFYTFQHRHPCTSTQRLVDFLCVEADTIHEAVDRAVYFGLVLDEPPSCGANCCLPEWRRPRIGDRVDVNPQFRGREMEHWGLAGYNYITLYKNGDMRSNTPNEV